MRLNEPQLQMAEQALLGPDGQTLIELMSQWSMGRDGREHRDAVPIARELGWVDDTGSTLTRVGMKVADPLREFSLWQRRGRTVHGADRLAPLAGAGFEGASVLEVGSGFGCNLFSMAEHAEHVVGVELEALYIQFTPLLAKMAGVQPPPVVQGRGEAMPVQDASFSRVLCLGALQYMDIAATLGEIRRVLEPGGEAVIVLGDFRGYVESALEEPWRFRNPRQAIRELRQLFVMASHPLFGRKLGREGDPIHPTVGSMHRFMERAGLSPTETIRIDHEVCYVVQRPQGRSSDSRRIPRAVPSSAPERKYG